MTETQGTTALGRGASEAPSESGRTSGAAGASTTPADAETEGVAPGGRAAVGRATVPASEPSAAQAGHDGSGARAGAAGSDGSGARAGAAGSDGSARYTRAPGMPSPPSGDAGSPELARATAAVSPALVAVSASVPVVTAPVPSAPPVSAPPGPGPVRPGASGRVAVGTMAPGRPIGAARVTEAVRAARGSASAAATRGPRRARLMVKRVDPWSVMKFSFAVSLVLFLVIIVATAVLYLALDAMGVFDSLNESLGDLLTSAGGTEGGGFKITFRGVLGVAGLLGGVNIVLVTALATLSAFIYNVCADLVGGVELTLSERD